MSVYKNRHGSESMKVSNNVTPSDYSGPTSVLTTGGISGALATGATKLSLGCIIAPAGPVLIAFGTSSGDAIANVEGGATPANLLGHMMKISAISDVDKVDVPESSDITHYAIAEGHGTPTGQLMVTQGI